MDTIRVLQEVTTMNTGGVETLLMNLYRNIDREKVQFDFLLHREKGQGFYEEEIRKLGGKIYSGLPFNPLNHKKYLVSLDHFFKEHPEYQIIHCHNAFSMYTLRLAMRNGINTRIAHSHNGRPKILHYKTPFKLYAKYRVKDYATDLFACSELAGRYYYGNKAVQDDQVKIIKNGIDVEKFKLDLSVRQQIRDELNLEENEIALVHIGRFNMQKNHKFLIDVYSKLIQADDKYFLFLFGEGELMLEVKQQVKKLNLEKKVKFMGVKGNIHDYLQAMDIFLLPSLFEGLPLTGIECQASGLPCLLSDTITQEVKITKLVRFLPINKDADVWVETIRDIVSQNKVRQSEENNIKSAGYDIKETAKNIQEFYIEKYKEGLKNAKS